MCYCIDLCSLLYHRMKKIYQEKEIQPSGTTRTGGENDDNDEVLVSSAHKYHILTEIRAGGVNELIINGPTIQLAHFTFSCG